ncbi:MAG: cytochrome d ubiquinol oxidase subunit II, partial [Armatimonadetes bacterium]|nr:cytochrome d ubiquinol oxidase subunit II [Armatimonadota bacterium]
MDLNTLWFALIVVLFTGFFFLEGFDYGVGILLPFLGRDDRDRRVLINTIGPFWDANETWMVTAGGAMFAAFPHWYATLFSGFYLPLALMLLALIVRGAGFEFRSKDERPGWRSLWDWLIFVGSFVPALLWGVALANAVRGVPLDADMNYVGGFFNLLNPYALVGGLASLALFTLHGALFLILRTEGALQARARAAAMKLGPATVALLGLSVAFTYHATDFGARFGVVPGGVPVIGGAAILSAGWLIRNGKDGWAFTMTGLTIASAAVTLFTTLFPRVMVSSLNPAWSLTIYNASSSHYTLTVMSFVALLFVPVMLAYQLWT